MLPDPQAVAEALAMYELSRMEGPAHNRTKFWQHLTDETAQPMADAARAYADSEEVCGHQYESGGRCGRPKKKHDHWGSMRQVQFHPYVPARLILENTDD